MTLRASLYVDGFNLFHAIDDLQQPHLKWLDLWALGTNLIPSRSETLVKVVWCTAVRTDDVQRQLRHRAYQRALELAGVECLTGHFADDRRDCKQCGHTWAAPVEKQGDVNLALAVIDHAYQDMFDHAYLLTADGDQTATAKLLKARFPSKKLTTVSPPRRSHSKHILALADAKIALNEGHLERAVFPRAVVSPTETVVRPRHYDPPAGWLHPNERPGKR